MSENIKAKNPGGRPREWDLEILAEELIEWSTDPSSMNLIGFSSPRRFSVTRLPDWAAKDEKFSEALQLAKENIGLNRFQAACMNEIPYGAFSGVEGNYDPLHERYKRESKRFESSLRKEEEGAKYSQVTIKVQNDGLGAGLNVSTEALPTASDKSTK